VSDVRSGVAEMLKVALTGGIATGKSYVLARFRALGVPVIDADELAHEALAPGTPAASQVVERFGAGVLRADRSIDRRKLAVVVFGDHDALRDLEAILHPGIIDAIEAWFEARTAEGHVPWALADIPLLYEVGLDVSFDRVIVTVCEPDEQVRRVMERDRLSEADALARLASQIPVAEKVRRADFAIRTDGSFADTDRQVEEVYRRLTPSAE
jgi:dephospho-CoA kinase